MKKKLNVKPIDELKMKQTNKARINAFVANLIYTSSKSTGIDFIDKTRKLVINYYKKN